MRKQLVFLLIVFLGFFVACDNAPKNKKSNSQNSSVASSLSFQFDGLSNKAWKVNDSVTYSISSFQPNVQFDSAVVSIDGQQQSKIYTTNSQIWATTATQVGEHKFSAVVYFNGKKETIRASVELASDIIPAAYGYEIVNTFPHDPTAFTQGLLFQDDIFYEGTGMKGASELRKVVVETGEILQKKELSSSLFGEGITIFKGALFQLTWKAGIAITYDKNTFEEVSKFYYQGDGWGITNNSTELIMSNGSQVLRFIHPQDFTEIRSMEVYDNNGAVGYLNELEWIDGKIYANVWQKNYIVIIDPQSGKVEGKINLNGLWPANKEMPGVLNGIAYDIKNKRLFVTGKYWPQLYEIKMIPKTTSS